MTHENATPTPIHAEIDIDGRHQAIPLMARSAEFLQEDWPYHPRIGHISFGSGHATREIAVATAKRVELAYNNFDILVAALEIIATTAQQASMHEPEQFCSWAFDYAQSILSRIKESNHGAV
jgi:hypothetical protein